MSCGTRMPLAQQWDSKDRSSIPHLPTHQPYPKWTETTKKSKGIRLSVSPCSSPYSWARSCVLTLHPPHTGYLLPHRGDENRTWQPERLQCRGSTGTCTGPLLVWSGLVGILVGFHCTLLHYPGIKRGRQIFATYIILFTKSNNSTSCVP